MHPRQSSCMRCALAIAETQPDTAAAEGVESGAAIYIYIHMYVYKRIIHSPYHKYMYVYMHMHHIMDPECKGQQASWTLSKNGAATSSAAAVLYSGAVAKANRWSFGKLGMSAQLRHHSVNQSSVHVTLCLIHSTTKRQTTLS